MRTTIILLTSFLILLLRASLPLEETKLELLKASISLLKQYCLCFIELLVASDILINILCELFFGK